MTRAFVAVMPPAAVLDAVARATDGLELPGARWSTRDQWHITLQFLGNHADVDAVGAALQDLVVAARTVRLGGPSAFPSPRRGRVLWLGVSEGESFLAQLAAAVGALLAPLGHEPEDRPYHPHLTLARCKQPTDLRPLVERLGDQPVGAAWTVGEVVLFESATHRDGAQYTPRASVSLLRST